MQNYGPKLIDSSRMVADILTADICADQEKFNEMFSIALKDVYPLSMRAARVVELCVFKHIELIKSHVDELLHYIEISKIDGVRRSFLKILAELPLKLDETSQGRLVDIAFSNIENQKEAIAIRSFSIDILMKFIGSYPELTNELTYLLEQMVKDPSTGLRSKSKKTLVKLKNKIN